MRNINFIIIIGTFSISALGFGQDTLTIFQKIFCPKSQRQKPTTPDCESGVQIGTSRLPTIQCLVLPSITASHTAISTTNALMAFGTKLNQEVLSASDFNPALLNDLAVTQNYTTKI